MDEIVSNDKIIGSYRLLRRLDNGFSNSVSYIGEDIYSHDQVLVLLSNKQDSKSKEHFLAEAQFDALLNHPHIIGALDYGVIDDVPFMVMKRISGESISSVIPKGTQLPPHRVVNYVSQMADALQYAHDQRVVHRDVKPVNMILDKNDELYLTDFGLAVVIPAHTDYIETEEIIGTPAYMAPEQFRGVVSFAIDQYALAVVTYEWISGTRPFDGEVIYEIAYQKMNTLPAPLQQKVPSVPKSVEDVVLKALAKEPKERFPSVQAFAEALASAYGIDQPIRSRQRPRQVEVSLRILEEPLTTRNFAIILSALTELHTKCWLFQEGRFADLIDYTQAGNLRFDEEAILLITRIAYNSPAWLTLVSTVLSVSGLAAMTKLIDTIVQVRLRHKEKQDEIDDKHIKHRLEEIGKALELIDKYADSETKAQAVKAFIPTLVELGKVRGLEQPPLLEMKNTTTKTIKGSQSTN